MSDGDVVAFHRPVFDRIAPEKQTRILECAATEFSELGFTAANINVIAERAGISVGSLYKYFESKTHLYLEVVNHGLALIEEALNPILAAEVSLGEKIDLILDAIFESARSEPLMTRMYNRFTSEADSELARQLATRMESITAGAYADLIQQARAEGAVASEVDERVLAFCMDSIFLTLQFSLTTEYWRDRMDVYVGDAAANETAFKSQLSRVIRDALGVRP